MEHYGTMSLETPLRNANFAQSLVNLTLLQRTTGEIRVASGERLGETMEVDARSLIFNL
jgi:hypothetical protein